jgi:hypothetical protein
MIAPPRPAGKTAAGVRRIEKRIAERRSSIAVTLTGIAAAVRRNIVSPETLITAGIVGAMLHRGPRRTGFAVMTLVQTANAGIGAWRMFFSRTHDTPDHGASSPSP